MLYENCKAVIQAAAADLDAHLAGPPTNEPLSVVKLDRLSQWALNLRVFEQVTTFAGPVASVAFLTVPGPAARTAILSVQANLDTAITPGGVAVKLGIGPSGGTANKYGETSNLLKNQKLGKIPAWIELAASEVLQLNALRSTGAAGGTIGAAGESVRTKVVYMVLELLPDQP